MLNIMKIMTLPALVWDPDADRCKPKSISRVLSTMPAETLIADRRQKPSSGAVIQRTSPTPQGFYPTCYRVIRRRARRHWNGSLVAATMLQELLDDSHTAIHCYTPSAVSNSSDGTDIPLYRYCHNRAVHGVLTHRIMHGITHAVGARVL